MEWMSSWEGMTMATTQPLRTPYPVSVDARLDEPLSRWLWLVKWFLAIPHYVALAFLWVAYLVMSFVAFVAIVFTGRYPRSIFEFNVGVLRWSWRVAYWSYGALATDRYPPFKLVEDADFPAHLEIAYPERLSRGLPFVKWFLAIPHLVIVGLLAGGSWMTWGIHGAIGLLSIVAAILLLFGATYPKALFDVILGFNRWVLRVAAYVGLMTDRYPPFRLDLGGPEPGGKLTLTTDASPLRPPSAPPSPWAAAGPPTPPATAPSSRAWTGGRIAAIVLGILLSLVSFGVTVGGGALLWADLSLRDDAGYVDTGTHTFSTGTYAIATERIELPINGPWGNAPAALGEVRVRVAAAEAGAALFVGIGTFEEVSEFLRGAPHAVTTNSADATLRDVTGATPLGRPERETFWVASTSGVGAQTLEWQAEGGDWSIVVMNADASRGVAVRASVGATVPALRAIAIGLLAGGGVFLIVSTTIVAIASTRARHT
jgi:hypothetical protein